MEPRTDQRRSDRRECRIALRLLVTLSDGSTAEVKAETLVVNRHGAKIYANLDLLVGSPIQIRMEGKPEPVQGVVAWVSKDTPGIFGIEIPSATPPWDTN